MTSILLSLFSISSEEIPTMGGSLLQFFGEMGFAHITLGQIGVILIGFLLIFLAVKKDYEPFLLIPIGMGAILTNIPVTGLTEEGGLFYYFYSFGIKTGVFPLLIFIGVGALTDFGPLLADPKTILLGAAAQFGIFATLLGALALDFVPRLGISFTLKEACCIGIIGGADGPTAIYITSKLAGHLLGPVAIAAYSYMSLVPIIQPPIMRLLVTKRESKIRMAQLRPVSRREKILFPIAVILITGFFIPQATPLIGMLMFGNLMREVGVVGRLVKAAQNEVINIVTIFLGISVGATLEAHRFLTLQTLGVLVLGAIAFSFGTAAGVLLGKLMCRLSGGKVNPLIGAAGISAMPMSARVVHKEGERADPENILLMHAMGPNVAGQIGSTIAAGVILALVK